MKGRRCEEKRKGLLNAKPSGCPQSGSELRTLHKLELYVSVSPLGLKLQHNSLDSATRLTVSIQTCLPLDLISSNVPLVVCLFSHTLTSHLAPYLLTLLQVIHFPLAPHTRPLRSRHHGQCSPCSAIFGRHRALPWPSAYERGGAKVKRSIAEG
jgi:hypothetical protein